MSISLAKKNIKHKRKTMKKKQEGGIPGLTNLSFRGKKPKVEIPPQDQSTQASAQAAAQASAQAAAQASPQAAAQASPQSSELAGKEVAKTTASTLAVKAKSAEKEAKAKEKKVEKEAKAARESANEARKEFLDAKDIANKATETVNEMNKELDNSSDITEWLKKRKLLKPNEDINSATENVRKAQANAIGAAKAAKSNADKLEAEATTKEEAWLAIKKKNGSNVDTKLTCPDTNTSKKVLDKLQKRNIKSFTAAESANALNFNAAEYDKAASMLEKSNALLELVAPMLPPGTSQIISVSKALVLGIQKYNKQQELAYLSSECLSFVANISRDLAEMSAFYSNETVIKKNIKIDEALYEILVKNLFKFLYFLIDNIDFTNTSSGFYQYLFWYSFLSKVDFKKKINNKDEPENNNQKLFSFSYSCDECMPELLRKKLQEVSINGAPYKGLIDLKGVGSSNKKKTPKPNVATTASSVVATTDVQLTIGGGGFLMNNLASGAKSVATRANIAATGAHDFYLKNTGRPRPEKDLYGFCGDDIVALCKNYNDIIMRLIEYNMYKLIVATYNNINFLPLIFKDVTNDEFFDYIFKNIHIKDLESEVIMSVDTIKEKVTDYSITTPNTQATMCFDFLIQLKRIIEELECEVILPKTRPNSKGYGYATKGLKTLASFTNAYIGDPIVKYNTFLREYLIMTGNFATMISRYSLDHNRLSNIEKEEVVKSIDEKISKVEKGLKSIETQVKTINTKVGIVVSENEEGGEGEGEEGENQGENQVNGQGGGKITHNRLKKHSKKYKIYKKYKHSKKIKNKRKQKQY